MLLRLRTGTRELHPRIARVTFVRFAFALLISGLLLAGCSKKCKLHSDCSASERCVANECTVLCRTDRDCDGFGSCISGECTGIAGFGGGIQPGGGGGGSSGGGAGGGGGTSDGGTDGGTDAGTDAGTGGGTGGGGGAMGGGSGGGAMGGGSGGGGATGGGTGGGSVGGGAGGGGAEMDGGIDAGNGMGVYGDACLRGSDCATGLCVGNAATGLKMCTITCGSEAACDETHACLPVQGPSGTINICIPSDSGQACPNGMGSSCIAGLCLLHPGNTSLSVCATPCETTHSCPANFSCSLVQVGSQMQKVCSPNGGQCSVQGTSNQCITRFCSTKASAPSVGICTGNCATSADCPTGWACGLDDDLSSRCQPVGNPCTVNTQGNNDCFSKTCAQGTPQGDYCTALCMDLNLNPQQQRCPTGWTCVNAGTTMDPLWACEQ